MPVNYTYDQRYQTISSVKIVFSAVKDGHMFYFDGKTFVKSHNNGGSNAFNLNTGEPHYFYADTVVQIWEY